MIRAIPFFARRPLRGPRNGAAPADFGELITGWHPEDAVLSTMDALLKGGCQAIAADSGLEVAIKEFWYFPPTPFTKRLVEAVRDGAARHGLSHRDIVSGAGHDAVYMAKVAPAAK